MNIPENSLKKALLSGKTSYGIWNCIVDTYAGEICAGNGYDWVVIDMEHAAFDFRTTVIQAQALAAYPTVSTVVRPPSHDPALIKKLLDAGIQSLIVPMVETAEQATELVKAMRYPPQGIRGVASALARASRWNLVTDYAKKADNEICLIVQIESVMGIKNLEAILAVEGVDAILVGPADLAASMGHLGQSTHPEVVKAVTDCIRKARKFGKYAGTLAFSPELIAHYHQAGGTLLGIGVDLMLLKNSLAENALKMKNLL